MTILAIYWQDLQTLFDEALHSEEVSHIIAVPFLVSYIVYRKRHFIEASLTLDRYKSHKKLVSASDIVGISLCLTAFLLYWFGSYTFFPLEYHVLSLIVFIAGTVLFLANVKTLLALAFPILFLAFLVLPPSSLVYSGGALLADVNTQGSYTVLRAIGMPVSLSYKYGAPVIALNVSSNLMEFAVFQASSGVYSLIAFSMFAAFLVYIIQGPLIRRGALFLIGIFILPILNIIRISIIVTAAFWLGEETAMNVFHTATGWILIFGGMLLLLLAGEKLLHIRIFSQPEPPLTRHDCEKSPRSDRPFCMNCGAFIEPSQLKISKGFWAKAIALLIATYLVAVSFQAPSFAFSPSLTFTSASTQENMNVFPEMPEYNLQFLYRDVQYEKIAHQDANFVYAYFPSQNTSALPVYLIVAVATSVSNLHNWEVSLIAWQTSQGLQPLVTLLDSKDVQLTENPRIIARYIAFQHPSNYTYVALYWYQRALFNTGSTVEPRYIRVNLLVLTKNPEDSSQILTSLEAIGQRIALYWEPMRVQSLFSLAVPLQQLLLASSVAAALVIQGSQYALDQKRRDTNTRIFAKFAPPDEKLLLQAVKETSQKTRETTTHAIASNIRRYSNRSMKLSKLDAILLELERSGMIEAEVVDLQGHPKLVWKV